MEDVQPRVGYSDLLVMPDDGRRYEIHGGELVVVPSPLPIHQIAVVQIVARLHDYARRSGGLALAAPLDIVFDEHDVVQPDVVFFRAERRHLVQPRVVTRAAPDIAVEVLSPSTAAVDRGRKMDLFARYGVPEYWIADPFRLQFEGIRYSVTGSEIGFCLWKVEVNGPGGRRVTAQGVRRRTDCRFWRVDLGAWKQDNLLGWVACASEPGWGRVGGSWRTAQAGTRPGRSSGTPAVTGGPSVRGSRVARARAVALSAAGEGRCGPGSQSLACCVRRVAAGQALRAPRVRGRTTSW
jgi:Uma2 family endonuclease